MLFLTLACIDPIPAPTTTDSGAVQTDTGAVADTQDPRDTEGDTGQPQDTSPPDDTGSSGSPDYTAVGPIGFTSSNESMTTSTGCSLTWVQYTPEQTVGKVVLAHGFMRSGAQMVGWAEHLASWGLEVSVPDLCWSGFTPDPAKNAQDINELASGPVALVGHSAGGLAVMLAAADGSATAVIGLDPVEQFGQDNSTAAASVSAPSLALFGQPGSCNSQNSGATFFGAVPDVRMMDLTGADHCDFENPTDGTCEVFCTADDAGYTDDQRRDALAGVVTAFVLGQHVDAHIDDALAQGVLSNR